MLEAPGGEDSAAAAPVEAEAISKWYGETTALDGVDLRLDAGTVHGLVGPNGAGKTTLLSAIFGLVRPDEGALRLFGRTRAEAGAGWLYGVGGFVESPRFYPYLSGRANLAVLASLDDGDSVGVADLLELVGLADAGDRKVRGYSLGMRQRLGLAAALLRRPRLLVLDEPTNGMDPAGIRDLMAALRHLAGAGVAILLSSHDMHQVEELCDRVTVLHRGRRVFAGPLEVMRAQAPSPEWRIRTSDDAAAMSFAERAEAVSAFRDEGGNLVVLADQAHLDDYVIGLGRLGIAVRALSVDATPLEAFFFALTDGAQLSEPDTMTAAPRHRLAQVLGRAR